MAEEEKKKFVPTMTFAEAKILADKRDYTKLQQEAPQRSDKKKFVPRMTFSEAKILADKRDYTKLQQEAPQRSDEYIKNALEDKPISYLQKVLNEKEPGHEKWQKWAKY